MTRVTHQRSTLSHVVAQIATLPLPYSIPHSTHVVRATLANLLIFSWSWPFRKCGSAQFRPGTIAELISHNSHAPAAPIHASWSRGVYWQAG